jgi:hypothetical protein
MSDTLQDFQRDVRGLLGRVHGWSSHTWQARAASGGTRAERLAMLAGELADLGRRAGTGVPPGIAPPRLAAYALADQIAVLADDLVAALSDAEARPTSWAEIALAARHAVEGTRRDLGRR